MKSNASLEHKWRQIIKEHQSSGQSVTDFCKQRNFSDVTLYKWRKRLGAIRPAKAPKEFVPIVLEPDSPTKAIHHAHEISPEWLARYTLEMLKVLRS